jgi:ParB/RepB/Spo0J family partition protein
MLMVKISKALANDYARRAALGERPGYGDKENGYAGHFPTSEGEWDITANEAEAMLIDALKVGTDDHTKPSMAMAYTSLAARIKKQLDTLDEKVREVIEKQDGVSHAKHDGSDFIEVKREEVMVSGNIRTEFNDETLGELAADIKAHGLIHPITVRKFPTALKTTVKYSLVAGERRMRACELAGVPIMAHVIDVDQETALRIQFAENIHREDLSLMDRASAVQEIYQELGTMQAVADLVKKSKGWVSKLVAVAEGLSYWPTKVLEEGICEDMEALILLNKIDLLSQGTNRMWSIYEKMKAGGFGRKELQKVLKEIEEPKKETVAVKSDRHPVQPPVMQHARSAAQNNVQYKDPESGLTWTGRGKMPKWVETRLQEGKSLDDLRASKGIDEKEIDSPVVKAEEADEFEELVCQAWTIYRNNPSALEAWIHGATEIGALGDVFPRDEEDKLFFLREIALQFSIDEMEK